MTLAKNAQMACVGPPCNSAVPSPVPMATAVPRPLPASERQQPRASTALAFSPAIASAVSEISATGGGTAHGGLLRSVVLAAPVQAEASITTSYRLLRPDLGTQNGLGAAAEPRA